MPHTPEQYESASNICGTLVLLLSGKNRRELIYNKKTTNTNMYKR